MKTALISVSDKTGILDLARAVAATGAEILSTGGTARALREAGIPTREVSDYTGFPEMMDGRVKTLHPKIHGGLLHLRDHPEHVRQAKEHGIGPIDLVVVNLYPFEATIAKPGCTREEAIEQIDIGGPSMLRSAAKNHQSVTVVVDPADYAVVISELKAHRETTIETRRRLATKVYATTARYDSAIAAYLANAGGGAVLPEVFAPQLRKAQALRYGENPHQQAALYGDFFQYFEQLHGKELSYNNLLDLTAAVELIGEFDEPTVAILKHNNPCGVGQGASLAAAWDHAFATDRQAPYGGIIVTNRPLDLGLAGKISEIFSEVIIAPTFQPDARSLLEKKKNLRLMVQKAAKLPASGSLESRSCPGGVLVQQADAAPQPESEWKVVTKRAPTADEMRALRFGWRVVKRVKSNAIVFAGPDRTLGIGAGQMSRIDSTHIAAWKAKEAGLSLEGCAVASDAFFPFPDGLLAAADAGAKAAIQPGGSVKDAEVIAAADARGIAMVFTGRRHFRH
jgi:phosphoribosylaminoimidazolecarboxamide formyltransferase/IMP cyclohydrolase